MSAELVAGVAIDASSIDAAFEALPPEQVVNGAPLARAHDLLALPGGAIGVWEMTAGVATSIEEDEVFVVLGGSATIEFDEPPLPPVDLGPGVIVRLAAGMRTTWTVRETISKVYITL
ncbi:cupin domain-containing protein [uncultured Microbacterium sp.]|uniref:cupin domain-containing protein n=1 Tax=uncultured Microbacterium sp. TaxID=191216 RepID=UPI0035CA69A1